MSQPLKILFSRSVTVILLQTTKQISQNLPQRVRKQNKFRTFREKGP